MSPNTLNLEVQFVLHRKDGVGKDVYIPYFRGRHRNTSKYNPHIGKKQIAKCLGS